MRSPHPPAQSQNDSAASRLGDTWWQAAKLVSAQPRSTDLATFTHAQWWQQVSSARTPHPRPHRVLGNPAPPATDASAVLLAVGLVACAEVVQATGSHSRAVPGEPLPHGYSCAAVVRCASFILSYLALGADPAPGLSLSLNSPCRLQARARPRRSRRWRPCRKCPPPKASWLTSATCSAGPRRLERPCCAAQWRRTRRMPILWSRHSSPQETRPGTMPPPAYRSICHRHGCEATQLPARGAFSTMALATRAPTPDCALPSRS